MCVSSTGGMSVLSTGDMCVLSKRRMISENVYQCSPVAIHSRRRSNRQI